MSQITQIVENTTCLLCESVNTLRVLNPVFEQNLIYQCTSCDAIFNKDEMPVQVFNTHDSSNITILKRIQLKVKGFSGKISADSYIDYLEQHTNMKFKTAFDIGAGYGYLVKSLNNLGIKTTGIESNESMVKFADSSNIKHEFFNENYDQNRRYDLICMTQMIYYSRKNIELLEHVRKFLTPNGMIFIATTNPNSNLVKEKLETQLPHVGYNTVLSKKNFENLNKLELLDYTTYISNFANDFHSGRNKIMTFLKYYLGLKKPFVKDDEGNYAYVLLKNTP